MSKPNHSIPRLYDYANYCAAAVYRFSKDAGEEIVLYSMAPFFKMHFYQAFLEGEDEPDWEHIEASMSDFVESGDIDAMTEKAPLYEFFSDVVDGTLREFEQRASQSRVYFNTLAQISTSIRDLVDSIVRGEVDIETFVNLLMDRVVQALEPEQNS